MVMMMMSDPMNLLYTEEPEQSYKTMSYWKIFSKLFKEFPLITQRTKFKFSTLSLNVQHDLSLVYPSNSS